MSWIGLVRRTLRLAENVSSGLGGTRNALLGLWLAIDHAPPNVRDLFRGFNEDELQKEADELPAAELFKEPTSPARSTVEKTAALRWVAVRLRALESLLYSMDDGSSVRNPSDCLATFEDRSAYILLREP